MNSPIDLTVGRDGIATITWNMADRSMNVIDAESGRAFGEAVAAALGDDAVKGIVVTSAKPDFIAGADLETLLALDTAESAMAACQAFQKVLRDLETGGKPVVAAINGTALGGGFEVCLACHRRLVADDGRIRLGQPEVTLGLVPGGGATQRLPRLIGPRNALPLLVEGRRLPPEAALKAGLIDEIVDADMLIERAKAWIASDGALADQPWDRKGYRIPGGGVWTKQGMETFLGGNGMVHGKSWGVYPAPRAILSSVFEGLQVPIDAGMRIEARWFTNVVLGDIAKNMIRTLFFQIGDARKLRRRPEGFEAAAFDKIGVLGAGMMGAGIAFAAAGVGIDTVLLDRTRELAEKGKDRGTEALDQRVRRGRMSAETRDAIAGRVQTTDDFGDLAGCDLVIEAVFEDRQIKADATAKAEAAIGPRAIFASNTSTLPITGLAEASKWPENFIGLHFFSPVDKMPLVEIIRGKKTSDACLATAMDFVRRIGKTPIVVNDARGFYTSRVFGTYVQEGVALLGEGVRPALIENAGRLAGMPVGPLAVADEVSLHLIHAVTRQTKADLGDAYEPRAGDAAIATMVETLGRPGRKAGKGFYDYPKDGRKRLWPGLSEVFPISDRQPDVEEVKKRLLYIQGIETVRCLEEKVLTDPADGNVGSILGWGYAPQAGGTVSMIDTVGATEFTAECDRMAQQYGSRFTPPKSLRAMADKGTRFFPRTSLLATS